jgi:hypothetical protein
MGNSEEDVLDACVCLPLHRGKNTVEGRNAAGSIQFDASLGSNAVSKVV